MSIDDATGLITGSVTQAGSYNVTVSASDGPLSASQTFTWNVTAGTPEVTLAINNTLDHSDDLMLLGAAPIPVLVTLQHAGPGEHYVTLNCRAIPWIASSLSETASDSSTAARKRCG